MKITTLISNCWERGSMHCKYFITILFILFTFIVNANNSDTLRAKDVEFSTFISNRSGSNSIQNKFLLSIYNGGFIDEKMKNENYSNLKNSNRLGSISQAGLEYFQINNSFFGFKNSGFSFGIDYESVLESRFSKDAFALMFYGNIAFENDDVKLKNSAFRSLDFSTFRLGFRKKSTNSKHLFGVDLGFVNAYKYGFLEFEDASLTFSEDFETLSSSGSFNVELGDTSFLNDYSLKASGFSLQILYRYETSNERLFQLKIKNAGFIWMNSNSFAFSTPLDLNPNIVEVPNLLNMNGFFENTTVKDSILQLIFHNSNSKSFPVALPLEIQLMYRQNLNSNFDFSIQFIQRFRSFWIPYICGEINYVTGKRLSFGPIVSYGGYTNLNFGLNAKLRLWENSSISVGTEYISNMLFYSKVHAGIGGFITFTYKY